MNTQYILFGFIAIITSAWSLKYSGTIDGVPEYLQQYDGRERLVSSEDKNMIWLP